MRSHLVQITSKIAALAKCGSIHHARKLFDEMSHRDTVAWNAMISGYLHLSFHQEAISLFCILRLSNVKPDHFTYTAVLSTSAALQDVKLGRRLHALVTVSGFTSSLPVNNALIDMYGKCLKAHEANNVFEEMGLRNEVSWCSLLFAYLNIGDLDVSYSVFCNMPGRIVIAWNTMIAGYARRGELESSLGLFKKMLEDSCDPDQWTLSSTLNACSEMSEPCFGSMLHCYIIKSGWISATEVSNSVLGFCIKFGKEHEILKVVDSITVFNEVSSNVVLDAYMKIGNTEEAYLAFKRMPVKNLISFTSMITGYMRNGDGDSAFTCFLDLMRSQIRPDDIALGAVLHACSNLATLSKGRMVHGCVIQSGFHAYAYVGNGLVNMYAKCGDISDSCRAFNDILHKDLISWNTMLFAFGLHGRSRRALRILEEMEASGMKPDRVTFTGLLLTCNHLGLIEEGLSFFKSMAPTYGVFPDDDHVACVVDMLCRDGQAEKANELASKYVGGEKIRSLEALLGSCYSQGDVQMGARLAEKLQILNPNDEMSYVMLSNMYSASGMWREVENVRNLMVEKGVRKVIGCSWIEVGNEVTTFAAGSVSFPCVEDVNLVLYVLECDMRYPPSLS